MKNLNTKNALLALCVIAIAYILVFVKQTDIKWINAYSIASKIAATEGVVILIFASFLWKCKIFRNWLVLIPNLNGTWKGSIQTTWVNPDTGLSPSPIPCILTVQQSLFNISCVMRTKEMQSHSFSEQFMIDNNRQHKILYYMYDSNPSILIRNRSPIHEGAMRFEIIGDKEKTLVGSYWTARKTTGEIKLKFWKKSLVCEYPDNIGDHPVLDA